MLQGAMKSSVTTSGILKKLEREAVAGEETMSALSFTSLSTRHSLS